MEYSSNEVQEISKVVNTGNEVMLERCSIEIGVSLSV